MENRIKKLNYSSFGGLTPDYYKGDALDIDIIDEKTIVVIYGIYYKDINFKMNIEINREEVIEMLEKLDEEIGKDTDDVYDMWDDFPEVEMKVNDEDISRPSLEAVELINKFIGKINDTDKIKQMQKVIFEIFNYS